MVAELAKAFGRAEQRSAKTVPEADLFAMMGAKVKHVKR